MYFLFFYLLIVVSINKEVVGCQTVLEFWNSFLKSFNKQDSNTIGGSYNWGRDIAIIQFRH